MRHPRNRRRIHLGCLRLMLHRRHVRDALREWRMLIGLQAGWLHILMIGVERRVEEAVAHICYRLQGQSRASGALGTECGCGRTSLASNTAIRADRGVSAAQEHRARAGTNPEWPISPRQKQPVNAVSATTRASGSEAYVIQTQSSGSAADRVRGKGTRLKKRECRNGQRARIPLRVDPLATQTFTCPRPWDWRMTRLWASTSIERL